MKEPLQQIVIMGVSGCGKTTVARALAERLACRFCDADDFHSPENIEKMRSGRALSDSDRVSWLGLLASHLADAQEAGERRILACSALKQSYRELLESKGANLRFIYLAGSESLLRERLRQREGEGGHFFPAELLSSQLETLEEPQVALKIDISLSIDEILAKILLGEGFH